MTRKLLSLLFLMIATVAGETHSLTLKQAVKRALSRNPDLVLARLDHETAVQEVRLARDPFLPKIFVGSGLAATYGFPMTLDSGAPSLFQMRASAALINRPERYRLGQARSEAESTKLASRGTGERVVMRTVELFLDVENAARAAGMVRQQRDGLEKILAVLQSRAEEGRALAVDVKRARLDVARAGQRLQVYEFDLEDQQRTLASALGYPDGDLVSTASEERTPPPLPDSEDAAVRIALNDNTEIQHLERSLEANGFALRAGKAEKYPRINLIGQYALLAKFNNYEEFFSKFQRHNGQIGVSFELPLYAGPGTKARIEKATIETRRLETELKTKRNSIALDARRAYQEVRKAGGAMNVARLELEVAREELGTLLAKMDEGRAALREVEAARYIENEKWISFYEARYELELARYRLLNRTGGLVAALR